MKKTSRKIRYAVIGQGYISQIAVLPAFKHARGNSELAALVSDDSTKLRKLGRKYGVKNLYGYDQYQDLLNSGEIDAVYIALPNHLHRDYAVRAAQAGIHVLCEKPMEVTPERCEEMIVAARENGVKLMIAYRLHFEAANLCAAGLLKRGRIGEPKIFNSTFSIAVDLKNYRAGPREKGGGPTFDVGIYCINAARTLFRDEPIEVTALDLRTDRKRFAQSEETMAVSLRFPGDRVANFVCSFGTAPCGSYQVVGTKGNIVLENAYEYVGDKVIKLTVKDKTRQMKFKTRDQFAPELIYFSDCILKNREPEPSGLEGLADVRVIRAIFQSAETGRSIELEPFATEHPDMDQEIHVPPVRKPLLVKVKQPSKEEAA